MEWTAIESILTADASIEALRGNRDLISFLREEIKTKVAQTRSATDQWRKHYAECRKLRNERKTAISASPAAQLPDLVFPSGPNAWGVDKGTMRLLFLAYAWLRFHTLSQTEPKSKSDPGAQWIVRTINEYAKSFEAAKVKTNVA